MLVMGITSMSVENPSSVTGSKADPGWRVSSHHLTLPASAPHPLP